MKLAIALAIVAAVLSPGADGSVAPTCRLALARQGSRFEHELPFYTAMPDYALKYTFPRSARRASAGVLVGDTPVQLVLNNLRADDVFTQSTIGYAGVDLRELDGSRFDIHAVRLACGDGPVLRATMERYANAPPPAGPSNFLSVFSQPKDRVPECLAAIRRDGRLTLGFSRTADGPDAVAFSVRLGLDDEMRSVAKLWRRASADALKGRCLPPPAPPAPF